MFPTIPGGKKVIITKLGGDSERRIPRNNIPLIIEEDITLSFSSSFSPLMGSSAVSALSAVGAVSQDVFGVGFSGVTRHMGFQVWEGSSPISFNATFGFYMGQSDNPKFDARKEVYEPTMDLVRLVLPEVGIGGQLIPPGPSLMSLTEDGEAEDLVQYYRLRVKIAGVLTIDNAIVTKAEPTFSNETDENGYPIWSKVAMDFQSVALANQDMLDS